VRRLYETTLFCATLHPALSTGNGRRNVLSLGIDEGAVGMDALAMSLEIVQTREASLARRVRALVWL